MTKTPPDAEIENALNGEHGYDREAQELHKYLDRLAKVAQGNMSLIPVTPPILIDSGQFSTQSKTPRFDSIQARCYPAMTS